MLPVSSSENFQKRWLPWIIGGLATVFYFLTRAPGLDEWDAVQFANGVLRFNLSEHRPHPPGYPLYVFTGWVFHQAGMSVENGLLLASAIGGGVFAGAWFAFLHSQFGALRAGIVAAGLFFMTGVWMASTMAMTDAMAAGGIALALLAGMQFQKDPSITKMALLALWCAVACGVRPQNIGILLIIFIHAIAWRRERGNPRIVWAQAAGLFVFFQLLWFVPLLWTQARVAPGGFDWLNWPQQVWKQWMWRFDKPQILLGAQGSSAASLLKAAREHIGGWFTLGFAWRWNNFGGFLGLATLFGGTGYYLSRRPWKEPVDRAFWCGVAPWAIPYVAMILLTLPPDQRYYLPIYPLLLLPLAAGFVSLAERWGKGWLAFACVLPIAGPCIPYAIDHHREDAPPVRLVRFAAKTASELPAGEHPVFIFTEALRHAEWYAPELNPFPGYLVEGEKIPMKGVTVVYTDDNDVAELLKTRGWDGDVIQKYKRRKAIYRKHANVELWRLTRSGDP